MDVWTLISRVLQDFVCQRQTKKKRTDYRLHNTDPKRKCNGPKIVVVRSRDALVFWCLPRVILDWVSSEFRFKFMTLFTDASSRGRGRSKEEEEGVARRRW